MLTDLSLLVPSHSLDDFPLHLQGSDAAGVLEAWSALWHPALLAAAGKIPSFLFSGDSLAKSERPLVIVPSASRSYVTDDELSLAVSQGALIVDSGATRENFLARAMQLTELGDGLSESSLSAQTERIADFYALGFTYLQTELLTKRMRYTSHLDEGKFQRAVAAASQAWVANDSDLVKQQLSTAFDCLMQARSQFYPVDAFLIDIVLIAPSTIGTSLRAELANPTPKSVMLSGNTLQEIAEREPETLGLLRTAIENETVGLIVGDLAESEFLLMTHEEIFAELCAAKSIYEKHLGRTPTVFGRRRYGLTPALPQILNQAGFSAAWHVALDDGQFPESDRRKTRWEGLDDSAIDALASPPLDANRPESYISLSEELGNTMDRDFVATLIFARWPGQKLAQHNDLERSTTYSSVLGKFVTIENYFRDTEQPGNHTKFANDQYRPAYLRQAVAKNETAPISRHVRRAQDAATDQTARALATMADLIDPSNAPETPLSAAQHAEVVAAALSKPTASSQPSTTSSVLVINPLNFAQNIGLEASHDPPVPLPVIAEVPAMGFAWINPAEDTAQKSKRPEAPIAEGNVLRNRFCEVTIHPTNGGIKSIYDLRTHGNRLSQQLAIRLPGAGGSTSNAELDAAQYSQMRVDGITVVHSDAVLGRIASHGALLDGSGKKLALFTQTFSLWQHSRTVELEIQITNFVADLTSDPWNSYLACRFAWSETAADLRRSLHGCSVATEAKQILATDFISVSNGKLTTTVLPGGLPYHVRSGPRMLDTLLRVRGETESRFRLGIGIDLPHPWRAAQAIHAKPVVVPGRGEPTAKQGWLFHIAAPNVAATAWSPLIESGRVVGFKVRLLETEGNGGRVAIRSFKPATSAMHTHANDEPRSGLAIDGDAILLDIGAYEWTQVVARWTN
jgi:alpha-mannosidase